jgi:hypothetical protein
MYDEEDRDGDEYGNTKQIFPWGSCCSAMPSYDRLL